MIAQDYANNATVGLTDPFDGLGDFEISEEAMILRLLYLLDEYRAVMKMAGLWA